MNARVGTTVGPVRHRRQLSFWIGAILVFLACLLVSTAATDRVAFDGAYETLEGDGYALRFDEAACASYLGADARAPWFALAGFVLIVFAFVFLLGRPRYWRPSTFVIAACVATVCFAGTTLLSGVGHYLAHEPAPFPQTVCSRGAEAQLACEGGDRDACVRARERMVW